MKISELIKELERLRATLGDLDMMVQVDRGDPIYEALLGVQVSSDEDGQFISIVSDD